MSKPIAVRFLVEYQMMGDMEGVPWMNLVLNEVIENNDLVKDAKPVISLMGVYGIQMCVFTFDVDVEAVRSAGVDRDREKCREWATDIANSIVGDSDAEVRWVSTVKE